MLSIFSSWFLANMLSIVFWTKIYSSYTGWETELSIFSCKYSSYMRPVALVAKLVTTEPYLAGGSRVRISLSHPIWDFFLTLCPTVENGYVVGTHNITSRSTRERPLKPSRIKK